MKNFKKELEKAICNTCNRKVLEVGESYGQTEDGWMCGECMWNVSLERTKKKNNSVKIRFTKWQEPFVPRGSTNDIPGLSDKPRWEKYRPWQKNGGFIEPLLTSFDSNEKQILIEGICFDTKDLADHIKKFYEQQGNDKEIRIFFNEVRLGNFPVIETPMPNFLILGKENIIDIELAEKERLVENIEILDKIN